MVEMSSFTTPQALVGVVSLTILYQTGSYIYNIFFHPLRKFPGRLMWRMSRWPWVLSHLFGMEPFELHEMHAKYGSVVRIAPNELSFSEPEAWKDIYGRRFKAGPGNEEMPKYDKMYDIITAMPKTIMNENWKNHVQLRRGMAPGFSEKSIRAQEPIIKGYADELMQRLRHLSVDPVTGARKAFNVASAYNRFTFGVVGDLVFGEPFGPLADPYFNLWVKVIAESTMAFTLILVAKYLGLGWILNFAFRSSQRSMQEIVDLTDMKVKKRVETGMGRPDLMEDLLRIKKEMNMDMEKISHNASILMGAGVETTTILLSGVTFLLCKHPQCLDKLKDEVRSRFKSEDEITLASANNLTYMLACLNEALRMYPPAPGSFPREVPAGGAVIAGKWVPEKTIVAVPQWVTYHNGKLWKDPFNYHPERFVGDTKYANDRRDSLQPFGVGPRDCIGRNLAFAEMRIALARVIYNFDISLADDSKDWINQRIYLQWKRPPLNVYLTPVHHAKA